MRLHTCHLGRFAGLFFGLFQAYCSAACLSPVLTAQAGIEKNVWQEFSDNGKQLVHEQGNLPFLALAGHASCDFGTLTLRGATTQGVRNYLGVSNTGTPLSTQSTLSTSELIIRYSYAINSQFEPFISVGISNSKRDINYSGLVLGYPEEFRMYPAQIGIRWRPTLYDNRLTLTAYGGRALYPQVKVLLPGRDVLTLDLGHVLKAGLSAELELGVFAKGQFVLITQLDRTHIAKGVARTVTRNGVPTGVANQPRSLLTQTQMSIIWRKSL